MPLEQARALAYLIGLIRSQEATDGEFLKDYCLEETNSLRLWLTAIKALGRLANRDDRQLVVAIATDNKLEGYQHIFLEKMPLAQRFPKRKQQILIRRRAIAVLADIGDQNSVATLLEAGVDNELSRATYQAASDIFTRVG